MTLRIVLVVGLGLHKLVWELLERRSGASTPASKSKQSLLKRAVKLGKVGFLIGIVVQAFLLPDFPAISRDPDALRIIGGVIYAAGLLLAIAGRLQLGDNWANLEDYQVLPQQNLVSQGVYGHIRHPIYAGDMLLLLGYELALNSWFVLGIIALIAIVARQARAEEDVLAQAFPGYEAYRKRTKMFIPYVL